MTIRTDIIQEEIKKLNHNMNIAVIRNEIIEKKIEDIKHKARDYDKQIDEQETENIIKKIEYSIWQLMMQNNKKKLRTTNKNTFELSENGKVLYRKYRTHYLQPLYDILSRYEQNTFTEFLSTKISEKMIIPEEYEKTTEEIITILMQNNVEIPLNMEKIAIDEINITMRDNVIEYDTIKTQIETLRAIEHLNQSTLLDDTQYNKIVSFLEEAEQKADKKLEEHHNNLKSINGKMNSIARYFIMREFITDD